MAQVDLTERGLLAAVDQHRDLSIAIDRKLTDLRRGTKRWHQIHEVINNPITTNQKAREVIMEVLCTDMQDAYGTAVAFLSLMREKAELDEVLSKSRVGHLHSPQQSHGLEFPVNEATLTKAGFSATQAEIVLRSQERIRDMSFVLAEGFTYGNGENWSDYLGLSDREIEEWLT